MAVDHYENFPVASLLLPARLRQPVAHIYAFARSADDLADEGDARPEERLRALDEYLAALNRIEADAPVDPPLFRSLAATIAAHRLPLQPFRDLLSAFKQDVAVTRYATRADLLDYCRRSANPVGLLMLHLYEAVDAQNCSESDAICSALQLINFWQDVAIDYAKGRIYLPQDDLRRFGVLEQQLGQGQVDGAFKALMQEEVQFARQMLLSGAPLALRLHGRVGWELRMVVQGGLRILDKIEQAGYDVFRRRPRLAPPDWAIMAARAARMKIRLSQLQQVG